MLKSKPLSKPSTVVYSSYLSNHANEFPHCAQNLAPEGRLVPQPAQKLTAPAGAGVGCGCCGCGGCICICICICCAWRCAASMLMPCNIPTFAIGPPSGAAGASSPGVRTRKKTRPCDRTTASPIFIGAKTTENSRFAVLHPCFWTKESSLPARRSMSLVSCIAMSWRFSSEKMDMQQYAIAAALASDSSSAPIAFSLFSQSTGSTVPLSAIGSALSAAPSGGNSVPANLIGGCAIIKSTSAYTMLLVPLQKRRLRVVAVCVLCR
mmetsp:Transcript_28635/g.93544  ORF Transcript_28635/g.93544 Transcript_28635/m.93544 type:complete len:265 (-) Transcript_28635:71-865(-)